MARWCHPKWLALPSWILVLWHFWSCDAAMRHRNSMGVRYCNKYIKFCQSIINAIIEILSPGVHFKNEIHKIRLWCLSVCLFVRLWLKWTLAHNTQLLGNEIAVTQITTVNFAFNTTCFSYNWTHPFSTPVILCRMCHTATVSVVPQMSKFSRSYVNAIHARILSASACTRYLTGNRSLTLSMLMSTKVDWRGWVQLPTKVNI